MAEIDDMKPLPGYLPDCDECGRPVDPIRVGERWLVADYCLDCYPDTRVTDLTIGDVIFFEFGPNAMHGVVVGDLQKYAPPAVDEPKLGIPVYSGDVETKFGSIPYVSPVFFESEQDVVKAVQGDYVPDRWRDQLRKSYERERRGRAGE